MLQVASIKSGSAERKRPRRAASRLDQVPTARTGQKLKVDGLEVLASMRRDPAINEKIFRQFSKEGLAGSTEK